MICTERTNTMLKYLLISRKGSGRTFTQNLLENNGVKVSHPCNDQFEHDKLATANVISVAPEHVEEICKLFPNDIFRIVMITAKNEDRLKHRTEPDTASFVDDCAKENDTFCSFEDKFAKGKLGIDNVMQGQIINNDFSATSDVVSFAKQLPKKLLAFERMSAIVNSLIKDNFFETAVNENGEIMINTTHRSSKTNETFERLMSVSAVVEQMFLDDTNLVHAIKQWLHSENFSLI